MKLKMWKSYCRSLKQLVIKIQRMETMSDRVVFQIVCFKDALLSDFLKELKEERKYYLFLLTLGILLAEKCQNHYTSSQRYWYVKG